MPSRYNGQSADSPVQPVTRSKVASAKRLMAAGFTAEDLVLVDGGATMIALPKVEEILKGH